MDNNDNTYVKYDKNVCSYTDIYWGDDETVYSEQYLEDETVYSYDDNYWEFLYPEGVPQNLEYERLIREIGALIYAGERKEKRLLELLEQYKHMMVNLPRYRYYDVDIYFPMLVQALAMGCYLFADRLIDYVDVTICTSEDTNAIHAILIKEYNHERHDIIYSLIRKLIDRGVDINQQDERGNTVLHNAALSNNLKLLKLICECGAKINIQNNDKQTPFDIAIEWNRSEIVEYFHSLQGMNTKRALR